ncbi:hypothetical protein C2G38_2301977 [Gigaspora rosea]|uniref:Uncharacterized protein n=1 Tax=Gigaspora rosea TaxID=44941 RepID=A0A397VEQ3_9GLOM|nr:hypothetical protein C2G38_2301977 [Gigaspora rosea]
MEQLEEFNEIIDQSLCDPIDDNQIPKVLEFTLKIIENIIKVNNNKGTEEIDEQRSIEIKNTFRCHYVTSIAGARNNEVTIDATESAEVEKIICLASNIEIPAQEVYQKLPYLSTALKPYDAPELSEETAVSYVIPKEEVLEEKQAEIDIEAKMDLEDLIDDYLKVVKGWSSGSKGLEVEIGHPLKVNNKEDLNKINLGKLNEKEEVKIDNVPVGPERVANNKSRMVEVKKSEIVKALKKEMDQEKDN